MSGVDDLKAAVQAVGDAVVQGAAAVTAEIAAVDAAISKLSQGGGLSDAEAEELAQQLSGVKDNLTAATTALNDEASKVVGL